MLPTCKQSAGYSPPDCGGVQELFSSCGTVKRLVLPPTKTLAIVEFAEAGEARSAFRGLAYKRFHHVPIYLEWAPSNIFKAPAPPKV